MRSMLVVLVLLAGCGLSTDLEGIYWVDTWTRTDTSTYDVRLEYGGYTYVILDDALVVDLCDGPVPCEQEAHASGDREWTFRLDEGSDGGGWTGTGVQGPDEANEITGGCGRRVYRMELAQTATDSINMRRERYDVTFAARDGLCTEDDAIAAVVGPPTWTEDVHIVRTFQF